MGELDAVGQVKQVDSLLALIFVENFPAPHAVHTNGVDPAIVLYVPPRQSVQFPPFGPVDPALQVQFCKALLFVGELDADGHARQSATRVAFNNVEYVFKGQSSHGKEPLLVLYLPETHDTQGPPFAPVQPILQVH